DGGDRRHLGRLAEVEVGEIADVVVAEVNVAEHHARHQGAPGQVDHLDPGGVRIRVDATDILDAVALDQQAAGQGFTAGAVDQGGQGKTAIVQHWLEPFLAGRRFADGVFLWSFYRGKEADLCLRQLYAYATGSAAGDVSASYCVDHLLPQLRRERWAVVLDGT